LGIHDLVSGKTTTVDPKLDKNLSVRSVAVSADGKRAACLWSEGVLLFDAATGKQTRRVALPGLNVQGTSGFTPDGKHVVLRDQSIYVVVAYEGGRPCSVSLPHSGWQDRFALLPDSRRLVIADWYGVTRIHDLKTGRRLDAHSRFPCFDGVQMLGSHRAAG